MTTLARRLVAEGLGTALLLAVVVGSGIMAERLAGGNVAIALLANAIATGAGLVALILMFGTISGAHFNPVVTLSEAWQKNMPASDAIPYIVVQIAGAFAGVAAAHLMFDVPVVSASTHVRTGVAQWWSEFVATFGLVAVIIGCSRSRPGVTPFAVAAYIVAAYWFTSSTSFANPAVTLARSVTNTFAGIRPVDTIGFIIAQMLGAAAATPLFCWLYPAAHREATVAGTVAKDDFAGVAARRDATHG
ncbi:aquaporin family protein [Massilia pinisoli]|uniref:Aquaporin family protein n=1 Tax=Massilia pinisoli TaxID=1772194 RepID=A0ABT1ZLE4_9BURK|nr:MIP/aquaporin family protein [Massilia pinisoli]MCS0580713.1 aquaporin family protein [Massilia pinisoli]